MQIQIPMEHQSRQDFNESLLNQTKYFYLLRLLLMKIKNLFADNIVIQHLKSKPRNQWNEEDIIHMYREIETLKMELSISSVVPCTI